MADGSAVQIPWSEERVISENWEREGCHVLVDGKHVLTLNTPESLDDPESDCCFVEDWISPEEFCANLTAVLRGFGGLGRGALGGRRRAGELPKAAGEGTNANHRRLERRTQD